MTNRIWNKTDATIKQVYSLMVRDFRRFEYHPIMDKSRKALYSNIAEFRNMEWPVLGDVAPYRFKVLRQLELFLKRHRFSGDVFDDEQLEVKAQEAFLKTQARLPSGEGLKGFVYPVLQEARKIAISMLGKTVDHQKLLHHCRIGKRATLGCSLPNAYLDSKLEQPPMFTCPTPARKWFWKEYLPTDHLLSGLVRQIFRRAKESGKKVPLSEDYLNLATVPKSWKSLRGITPMSLIGLFLSYGIKALFEEALVKNGLNIRTAERKHRKLARAFSKPLPKGMMHATVDLSEASNSIVSWLLMRVLPYQFYKILRMTFIRQIVIADRQFYSQTVLFMGNAATFPVETLLFYCLIRAIGNLLGVKGTYSVYGDDLIYPCKIHRHVVAVFAQLGLKMNAEKTFGSLSFFRESCGGDYYRGVDVRPALAPEHNATDLTRLDYQAWLYKLYNGLLRRWTWHELPSVFCFLLSEIAYTGSVIHTIPPSYPDYAGIKDDPPIMLWLPIKRPVSIFNSCTGSRQLKFSHLSITTPNRVVSSETAYYWEWHKNRQDVDDSESFGCYTDGFRWAYQFARRSSLLRSGFRVPVHGKIVGEPSVFLLYKWKRRRVEKILTTQFVPQRDKQGNVLVHCKVKDCFSYISQVSSIPNWA